MGSIGWCMGGGDSLDLALQEPTLAADVIHYGHLATDAEALNKTNAAIVGIFGGNDQGIPPESVKMFEATFEAAWQKGRDQDLSRCRPWL